MAVEFNGTPFQYNPAVTNVNIDNQLAGILGQFGDDYILDALDNALNNRFNPYQASNPNLVYAYELTFKNLSGGFGANNPDIINTRNKTYLNIINKICNFYGLNFNPHEDTELYSAAFWLYDFFVSSFSEHLKMFYAMYLIQEKDALNSAFNFSQLRKENDATYSYSKKLFKDPVLAAIHCNIDYVINQIDSFNISLDNILSIVYSNQAPTLAPYIASIVSDPTGGFFRNFYQTFVLNSPDSADIMTYIKLALQQIGGDIEPIK